MDTLDFFIAKARHSLPDLCTVKDLKRIGLIKGPAAARAWRNNKKGPDYFKLNGRYFYPKEAILQFLKAGKCCIS